jgi:hypothetical protein
MKVISSLYHSYGVINLKTVCANLSVKRGKSQVNNFLKLLLACGGKLTPSYITVTVILLRYISTLITQQGFKGTANRLKAASVLIQQALSGFKIVSMNDLKCRISRSKSGLPRFLPALVRQRMVQGDLMLIRYILSILSVYRIFEFQGKLKLNTITDISTMNMSLYVRLVSLIPSFISLILRRANYHPDIIFSYFKPIRLIHVFKSSANSLRDRTTEAITFVASHPFSIFVSVKALLRPTNKVVFDGLIMLLRHHQGNSLIMSIINIVNAFP